MNEKLEVLDERTVLEKEFRVYGTFDEPLFLAKDVAEWIEHTNPSQMIKDTDLEENEVIKRSIGTLSNAYSALFLTEDGLYEVLMQSRKPIAKQFKKKVKEILKEIRKTGSYSSTPKKEKLSSVNNAARTILPVLAKAGMKAQYQVLFFISEFFLKKG